MKKMERDLVDLEHLFVKELDKIYVYQRVYTSSMIPTYIPPPDKHIENDEFKTNEALFIPISDEDFKNQTDYFFGFQYKFIYNNHMTIGTVFNPFDSLTNITLEHEIRRFRFYPENKKTIIINKIYDPLFPIVPIELEAHSLECNKYLIECMGELIDHYSQFYYKKRI